MRFLMSALLLLGTEVTIANPISVTEISIDTSSLKINFETDAKVALAILESEIAELPIDLQKAYRDYIDVSREFVVDPRVLAAEELGAIYCSGTFDRSRPFPGQIAGLHDCVDSDSGEVVSRSVFKRGGLSGGFNGQNFADFHYYINNQRMDFRNWQALQVASLMLEHLRRGIDVFEISMDGSVGTEVLTTWRGNYELPKLRFNPEIVEEYIESKLLPIFRRDSFWSRNFNRVLQTKRTEIPNGITYNTNGIAVDAVTTDGNRFGGGYPAVIAEAGCRGNCVAIERSTFADSIGTYTYAWQILYYTSVWENFRLGEAYNSGYGALQGVNQPAWFVWLDMVAGNRDPDALRNSTFFRRQFELMTIVGAVR
jgi:hypothetical protein